MSPLRFYLNCLLLLLCRVSNSCHPPNLVILPVTSAVIYDTHNHIIFSHLFLPLSLCTVPYPQSYCLSKFRELSVGAFLFSAQKDSFFPFGSLLAIACTFRWTMTIKVGIIGVGRIGRCHLESLAGLVGVQVTMVRDFRLFRCCSDSCSGSANAELMFNAVFGVVLAWVIVFGALDRWLTSLRQRRPRPATTSESPLGPKIRWSSSPPQTSTR